MIGGPAFLLQHMLTSTEVGDTKYGVVMLIHARCIDGFQWAIECYPQLAKATLPHLGTTLHLAAINGTPDHVRILLDKRPDGFSARQPGDFTALEAAVENGKLDVADLLMECNDCQRLLGSPLKYGHWLFGCLLNQSHDVRKRIPLETFHWLKKCNALQFFPNAHMRYSLWNLFFSTRCVARAEVIEEDLQLLNFLLQPDTFLNQIHETDVTGQAAIHYAARGANLPTLKLLVSKGADINQPVPRMTSRLMRFLPTATPL